jgi:hypothetical protein
VHPVNQKLISDLNARAFQLVKKQREPDAAGSTSALPTLKFALIFMDRESISIDETNGK